MCFDYSKMILSSAYFTDRFWEFSTYSALCTDYCSGICFCGMTTFGYFFVDKNYLFALRSEYSVVAGILHLSSLEMHSACS